MYECGTPEMVAEAIDSGISRPAESAFVIRAADVAVDDLQGIEFVVVEAPTRSDGLPPSLSA